jgi:polar amino acid transport system substrate-binding protein
MFVSRLPAAVLLALVLLVEGLTSGANTAHAKDPKSNDLRVGITPHFAPMIFKIDKEIMGVEADFARLLAAELKCELRFVELRWEQQIPALLRGKTDIIMSAMTATKARRVRIAFTETYYSTGLLAAVRTEDATQYDSAEKIMGSPANVGVIQGTTSDVFVERSFPKARKIVLAKAQDGAFELLRRTIDIFVNDAPSIIWLVSENEANLVARSLWLPQTEQSYAWGMERGNRALLDRVNKIINKWKQDGTQNRVLLKWLPYLQVTEE